jgi:hypothetical protein
MTSDTEQSQGIAISATGGVVIGLLLACFVIIGGFALVPAVDVSAEYAAYPRVDERIAGAGPDQSGTAIGFWLSKPIVLAEATVPADERLADHTFSAQRLRLCVDEKGIASGESPFFDLGRELRLGPCVGREREEEFRCAG